MMVFSGCQSNSEPVPVPETDSSASEEAASSFSVVGTDFKFTPDNLQFKAGETVQLTFQNEGTSPHNLLIEGTDLKTETIGSGEMTTFEFIAPDAGTYTFYCGVGGHRDAGMEGTLVTQ